MFITYKDCYRYYVVLSSTFRTCPEFVLRVTDKKVMSKHYKLYMNTVNLSRTRNANSLITLNWLRQLPRLIKV